MILPSRHGEIAVVSAAFGPGVRRSTSRRMPRDAALKPAIALAGGIGAGDEFWGSVSSRIPRMDAQRHGRRCLGGSILPRARKVERLARVAEFAVGCLQAAVPMMGSRRG